MGKTDKHTKTFKDSSASVGRIDNIFSFLSTQAEGASLATISKTLDLPRSTAARLVDSLCFYHYLEFIPSRNAFILGPRMIDLAKTIQHQMDIVAIASPFLWKVRNALDESVKLNVVQEDKVLVKFVAESASDFRIHVSEGTLTPLYCGAANKVLLTFSPSDLQKKILDSPKEHFTATTLTEREQLSTAMNKIRQTGFGYDNTEYVDGICAVGVPVFSVSQDIAGALSIAFIDTPLNQTKNRARLELLMDAAQNITERLGGNYPYTLPDNCEKIIELYKNM